jgi:hypothetical protein
MGLSGGRGTRHIHGQGSRQPNPIRRESVNRSKWAAPPPLSTLQDLQAGSVDADPMTWMVTQGMLERQIVKVKKAKAEHSGESAEGAFGVL